MAPQAADLHVNPADETIRLGPLGVRFLITGADARDSIALFELTVPGARVSRLRRTVYEETIHARRGATP